MTIPTCPPEIECPPLDEDQEHVAELFRKHGRVLVDAPPGTGKTFLGVYLALCASRLGWVSKERQALFLTFSRNARVRIEREISRYEAKGWITRRELSHVKVSNYHAFYLELLRRKAGLWGCADTIRPAPVSHRSQRLEALLLGVGLSGKELSDARRQAEVCFALRRFDASELTSPGPEKMLEDSSTRLVYDDAKSALKAGRPHYDDFAPLFLNLLELCPEVAEWVRTAHPVVILDEFQDTDCVQWQILRMLRPQRLVLLLDRFQMIYEWRGSSMTRLSRVVDEFSIPDESVSALRTIYRVGEQEEHARYVQQLRLDDLRGGHVAGVEKRQWLVARPVQEWAGAKTEIRCLHAVRTTKLMGFGETTAILTRSSYLGQFLHSNLRRKPKRGAYYRCRWMGSDSNPDEVLRDHVWRLRQVTDGQGLRGWIGGLLDQLLPPSLQGGLCWERELACTAGDLLLRKRKPSLKAVRSSLQDWWSSVEPSNRPGFARALAEIPRVVSLILDDRAYLDPDAIYYVRQLARAASAAGDSQREWIDFCDYLEDALVRSAYLRLRSPARGLHVMTVHQSKGREFDHVVIPWLSGAGEPHRGPSGGVFSGPYNYDSFEDRRLLYVALTRSRGRVTIIYPVEDPSLFLVKWALLSG